MTTRATPLELRRRDHAESWLTAGLCLARVAQPSPDLGLRVAPWADRVLSDMGALPPIGVLADIGYLVTGASMRTLAPLPPLHADFAQLIHTYEDLVLGRLDADPRLDAVTFALARLPVEQRDRGVALFISRLCRRLGFSAAVALSPGVGRRTMERPMNEVVSLGHAALSDRGDIESLLMTGYRDLIASARRRGSMIGEAEVFLMENLDALGDLTQQVAIEQIIEVAGALAAAMPRRLKPNASAELSRVPTDLAATDNYPTGGFSALSTSGSIENLVSSELIYMEDAVDSGALPDIDLFDVRFAEGELLYYTRDESVFVRGHRVISFVLMPGLVAARFKDQELSWQRLIVLLGLITCCVRRLATWLAHEGLSFHILFVRDVRVRAQAHATHPFHIERGLCELSLREFIAKGLVHVAEAESAEAALAQAGHWAESCRSDVVLMDAAPISLQPPPGVLLGTLTLDEAEPRLHWGAGNAPAARASERPGSSGDSDPWHAWVQCALALLQALL